MSHGLHIVAMVLLMSGSACTSLSTTSSDSSGRLDAGGLGQSRKASNEIEAARRLIAAGSYAQAIPQLQLTMSKYAGTKASHDARYYLGVSYEAIHSYQDAIEAFNDYLRVAPEGEFSGNSRKAIASLTAEYQSKYISAEELEERIHALTEESRNNPQDMELQWRLANLLWKRGNHGRAAEYYMDVVSIRPDFANRAEFRERIELLPDGQYIVLSPAEMQRRMIEQQPLVILNESSFKSGRQPRTYHLLYYVVTGQVHNRSDSVLYGVEVNVTIYGFGRVVYDTNTVSIGRMNPGEFRAYSVRFSNFPSIENVDRHESVASFQR